MLDEIYKKIKEEIENDPEKIGYEGKTDEEIVELLNSNIRKERIVIDDFAPPIHRILIGIANAPNVITKAEVVQAKLAKDL